MIDWHADTPGHPAARAPGGCTMLGMQIYHQEGDEIKAALNQLGVSDVHVNPANMRRSVQQEHGMCILLDTPKGRITISGDLPMTARERPKSVALQLGMHRKWIN